MSVWKSRFLEKTGSIAPYGAVDEEIDMKKLIFGLLAAATVGAAVPASAQVVIHERPDGQVVVRPAYAEPAYRYRYDDYRYDRYYHAHRVVWFDRWGRRHVEWR
jgi:hypothetical protein